MSSRPLSIGETNRELGEYIRNLTYDDIPDEVISIEKQHLVDTLGCILYGSTTPWSTKIRETIAETEGNGEVSVMGTDLRASPQRAAMLNATSSHSMDYDDYCQDGGIHAGAATIPSALALSETDLEIDGETFLTAVVAGVETGIRVGTGIGPGAVQQGWHIGGWTGAVAAAATTGKLLDLDVSELCNAIAVAATQGAGFIGATKGAEVKRFHMGKSTESGFLAALFAQNSLTGDLKIFEERWGTLSTLADTYDPAPITENLGEEYKTLQYLSFKPFPSVGTVHPSVNALEIVMEDHDLTGDDVASITANLIETSKNKVGWDYEPIGIMSAQGNAQYALASYLVGGSLTIDDYSESAIRRESVLDRISSIDVRVDNSLKEGDFNYSPRYRVRLEVTTQDGNRYEHVGEMPRGFPQKPMTAEEIERKFTNQATAVVSDEDATTALEFVEAIESKDDVSELVDVLR